MITNPWSVPLDDHVRANFERPFFGRLIEHLLRAAPGGRVLDLGCGDGLVHRLGGDLIDSYLGVDLFPPSGVPSLRHDLRNGLGEAGREPFDLCVATFGVASHLDPAQLDRLVREVAAAASSGALVAMEALAVHSLEWPGLWDVPPGPGRILRYRLSGEVSVHPWARDELRRMFGASGLRWLGALDRTVQAGPKLGDYWPGLPPLREGLAGLSQGDLAGAEILREPLPPLPAHPAARAHHALARRRRDLLAAGVGRDPSAMADAVWALEPRGGTGLGHGLVALGRAGS